MDVKEIREELVTVFKEHIGTLKVVSDDYEKFEVHGTIEAMQGAKKVDGIYFGSVVPKPKDVRFYFFPTYTHGDVLKEGMSEELLKCLKGKSCFHIKRLDSELINEIKELVREAINLYKKDGLLE